MLINMENKTMPHRMGIFNLHSNSEKRRHQTKQQLLEHHTKFSHK